MFGLLLALVLLIAAGWFAYRGVTRGFDEPWLELVRRFGTPWLTVFFLYLLALNIFPLSIDRVVGMTALFGAVWFGSVALLWEVPWLRVVRYFLDEPPLEPEPYVHRDATRFRADLADRYLELRQGKRVIVGPFAAQLVDVMTEVYAREFPENASFTRAEKRTGETYPLLVRTFAEALDRFTEALPEIATVDRDATTQEEPLFTAEVSLQFVDGEGKKTDFASAEIERAYEAFFSVLTPVRKQQLARLGAFDWPSFTPQLSDAPDFGESDKAWEKWTDDHDKAAEKLPFFERIAVGTPFRFSGERLFPQGISVDVPLPIDDATRFRHQWIVGDTGSGKTTLLSYQIARDLERVVRGECSLFIMDSQNELIPDIARLAVFGPGGDLDGKLVYLEPDPDFPLSLNIFDIRRERFETLSRKDRMLAESGAMWMVEFFLSSLVKSEATPHQDTFLNYLIPALMEIPDATIFTLKDLLEKGGYERYRQYFGTLRPDTQQWLATRMHAPESTVTRNAIRARLDGFTARGLFHDMFAHPRNKVDFFTELQSGKVILVNTMGGVLKSATEPFGRYFIARLLQATEERMLLPREKRLPVFCYIDEAADYIAQEDNIAELIDKARKQKVALILANQRPSQIRSANVLDALSRAAIQCVGGEAPVWNISVGRRAPVPVQIPDVRFSQWERMSDEEFEDLKARQRARYATTAEIPAPAPTTPSAPVEDDAVRPAKNY